MANYTYVELEITEARSLIDLTGIKWDLDSVAKCCDTYIECFKEIFHGGKGDDKLFRALAVAIPVTYARCFKGGVRKRLSAPLNKLLSKEEIDCHQLFLNLRDKHIAHSVNNFESGTLRVWLNPPERGKQINLINVSTQYLTAPGCESFACLQSVARKLLVWIDEQMLKEERDVKRIVEQRYTLDALYGMKVNPPKSADIADVCKPRKTD
jgi:hypothetical protein